VPPTSRRAPESRVGRPSTAAVECTVDRNQSVAPKALWPREPATAMRAGSSASKTQRVFFLPLCEVRLSIRGGDAVVSHLTAGQFVLVAPSLSVRLAVSGHPATTSSLRRR
jgi:hypothetical protein